MDVRRSRVRGSVAHRSDAYCQVGKVLVLHSPCSQWCSIQSPVLNAGVGLEHDACPWNDCGQKDTSKKTPMKTRKIGKHRTVHCVLLQLRAAGDCIKETVDSSVVLTSIYYMC